MVADIVARLKSPEFQASGLTVGVVTFNSEQMNLIMDLLRCPHESVASSSRVRSTVNGDRTDEEAIHRRTDHCFLREADAGLPVKELCRKHGFSEPSYYAWKAKFGGMNVSDAQRLKALEAENTKLKKLLANSMLEIDAMREVLKGK